MSDRCLYEESRGSKQEGDVASRPTVKIKCMFSASTCCPLGFGGCIACDSIFFFLFLQRSYGRLVCFVGVIVQYTEYVRSIEGKSIHSSYRVAYSHLLPD